MRRRLVLRHLRTPAAVLVGLLALGACIPAEGLGPAAIPLAGEWAFRLDHDDVGVERGWFSVDLPDRAHLPGSTDENHWGRPNRRPPDFQHLARLYEYTGPAWYQREMEIPASWAGRHIVLFLERCHWETHVWVDGKDCGMRDSLCVPHVYDLSAVLRGCMRSTASGVMNHAPTLGHDESCPYITAVYGRL